MTHVFDMCSKVPRQVPYKNPDCHKGSTRARQVEGGEKFERQWVSFYLEWVLAEEFWVQSFFIHHIYFIWFKIFHTFSWSYVYGLIEK